MPLEPSAVEEFKNAMDERMRSAMTVDRSLLGKSFDEADDVVSFKRSALNHCLLGCPASF